MERSAIWKSRPVFITSTFQDMQAERDHLRTYVFPALEEWLCTKRRHLEWIDLRVGVASATARDEGSRELLVLKVCLDEVKRSRPFLIGLIGDRYGWVPPKERIEAAAAEAGFSTDVTNRSVTDLEIDFGVFHDQEQQRRSLFFFRAPLPYDQMLPEKAAEYSDAHATDAGAASRVQQLEKLKARIKAELPGHHFDYRAEWDPNARDAGRVTGLEAWGAEVEEKIKQAIEEDLAAEADASTEQTEDEIERDALADFAEDRARDFTGRKDVLTEIEALLASPAQEGAAWGLCVTGEAGSGKSALFAALHQGLNGVEKDASARMSDEQRARYARLRDTDALVLDQAAGASPRATSVDSMLQRWIRELASFLGVDPALPDNPGADEVDAAFSSLLGRAAMKRRVVVLVDALDQFEATPRGRFVTWLPRLWPENARLIATAISGDASEALAQRPGIMPRPLPPLDAGEARDIAKAITARYHRQLEPEVLDALIADSDDANARWRNPLWLVLAVEELNLLDADDFARARQLPSGRDHERLRALMCDMAAGYPADIAGLYRQSFERAAELFGSKLAGAFLGAIAVSRSGWRESDFRAVLPRMSREAWDELRFAQLRRLFRGQLRQRGAMGQWEITHTQMRTAIRSWLVDTGVAEVDLHVALARYLLGISVDDPLRVTETMRHLLGGRQLAEAAAYYADPKLSATASAGATRFLADAWLADEVDPPILADLGAMLSLPDLPDDTIGQLAHQLLFDLHDAVAAAGIQRPLSNLLLLVHPTLDRLARVGPGNVDWQRDLSVSFIRIGDVERAEGNLTAVMASYRNSLEIENRLAEADPGNADWQYDLSVLHIRIGDIELVQGTLTAALASYQTACEIAERLTKVNSNFTEWQRNLLVSYVKIGEVQHTQGDLAAALVSHWTALDIGERLTAAEPANGDWQRDLSVLREKIGDVQQDQGNLAAALTNYQASFAIWDRLATADPSNAQWRQGLSVSQIKIGDVLVRRGSLPEALKAFRGSLANAEYLSKLDPGNAEWLHDLSAPYNRIGNVLLMHSNLPEALRAFRKSLAIGDRLVRLDPGNAVWQRDHSTSHIKIGDSQQEQGELVAALESYEAAFEIAERLVKTDPSNANWQSDLSGAHGRIGEVQQAQGNLSAALISYQASHDILELLATVIPSNVEWRRDLSWAQIKIGEINQAQGKLSAALASYRASLAIRDMLAVADPRNASCRHDVLVAQMRIGDVLVAQGNLPEALQAFRDSLATAGCLAKDDPGNAGWQRDLIVAYVKIAEVSPKDARTMLLCALDIVNDLQTSGRLAQRDARMPEDLTRRLNALASPLPPGLASFALSTPKGSPTSLPQDTVAMAQAMLAENNVAGAAVLLAEAPPGHGRANARAVCALRLGQSRQAINYLQPEILRKGGTVPHKVVPDAWIVTYATALALGGDPRSADRALGWVKDHNHPGATRLGQALVAWRKSLSWKEAASYRLGGKAPRPVTLDFPPGEL